MTNGAPIVRITLRLRVFLQYGVEGFLDLDGIEVIDDLTDLSLLDTSIGSFASDVPDRTHHGDWAANAIDRLGAIGWWGGSSDFNEGFYDHVHMLRGFLAGRSYGESVTSAGRGGSALVYGDPLYRPSAAMLFLPSEIGQRAAIPSQQGAAVYTVTSPGLIVTPDNLENVRFLLMNVLHGSSHLANVNWSLATCPNLDPAQCTAQQWTQKRAGTGSVKERPCDWTSLLDDPEEDQTVTIRLKVWNTGGEADALYDFASFDYRAGASAGEPQGCN
jgi:hypothetical protein